MDPNKTQWPKGDISDAAKEFALWLVTPSWEREPDSQAKYAVVHGLNRATLSVWKKDSRFQRYLATKADEYNLAPDRVQNVMNALYSAAVDHKDVKAMQLYLTHAEKLAPKTVRIEDARIASMSDEDIAAEIAQFASET